VGHVAHVRMVSAYYILILKPQGMKPLK